MTNLIIQQTHHLQTTTICSGCLGWVLGGEQGNICATFFLFKKLLKKYKCLGKFYGFLFYLSGLSIYLVCAREGLEGRYLEIVVEETVNYREISGEINDVKNYPNYLATQDQLMFNKYNTGAGVSQESSGERRNSR